MTIAKVKDRAERVPLSTSRRSVRANSNEPPRDLQRTFRLILATVWLLDAALQLQPFMFTRGSNGFSGMLNGVWRLEIRAIVYHWVTWNASNVYHYPILSNAIFASIQFLIAFGIVYKRTCKPALVLSIVWSIAVWWFGEGAGAIFSGGRHSLRRRTGRRALLRPSCRAPLAKSKVPTSPSWLPGRSG